MTFERIASPPSHSDQLERIILFYAVPRTDGFAAAPVVYRVTLGLGGKFAGTDEEFAL